MEFYELMQTIGKTAIQNGYCKKENETEDQYIFHALLQAHSELSECYDSLRYNNSSITDEIADVFIVLLGLCHNLSIPILNNILEKDKTNQTRGYMNGKKY